MGNRRQKHEQDTAIKLRFYFMSLWLLFVLIFLLTVDIPICFSKDHCNYVNIGLNSILKSDRIILVNGGESLEGSGRKIAIFAGKR